MAEPTDSDPKTESKRRVWEALPPEIQQSPELRRKMGLGDAVELVAKPIARALGRPEDCEPCRRRKAALNAAGASARAKATAFGRRIFRRGTSTK